VTLEGKPAVVLPAEGPGSRRSPGCHACTDLTSVDADISQGGGEPEGLYHAPRPYR